MLATDALVEQIIKSQRSFAAYAGFVHGWRVRPHQAAWFEALQALAEGRLRTDEAHGAVWTNKLMILAPPASGKTDTIVEFVAWLIGYLALQGKRPQIGIISYADATATGRSEAVRDIIENKREYQLVFDVAPDKSRRWAAEEWSIRNADRGGKDPTVRAAGLQGAILSYRFTSLIVIDDPHRIEAAGTEQLMTGAAEKAMVWRNYNMAVATRGVPGVTPIVLISTRLAADDLPGRLMEMEKDWKVVHTSGLTESDETYWPSDVAPNGNPCGVSTGALLARRESDPISFTTQYMALPPEAGASLFNVWTPLAWPPPEAVSAVFQSWDTATRKNTWNDYSAMVEGVLLKDGRVFIARALAKQMETVALMDAIKAEFARAEEFWHKRPLILVEARASGVPVVEMLRSTTGLPIIARDIPLGRSDLYTRATAVSEKFVSGRVVGPWEEWHPWLDAYKAEMRAYPRGRHDDQVAATVLLLEQVYSGYGGPPPVYKVSYGRLW